MAQSSTKFCRLKAWLIRTRIACLLLMAAYGHCNAQEIQLSDSLQVSPLTTNVWRHITLQYYPAFGTFTSNGLIYISGNEAVILDTPANDAESLALLEWLQTEFPSVKVIAIVINHFHDDCLGGLKVFHDQGIPSIAHKNAPGLMDKHRVDRPRPTSVFGGEKRLKVGNSHVVLFYPGAAHTHDNIVVWIPEEQVLFGGCMVKSAGASKGNIADADQTQWPKTIERVRRRFPDAKTVVPGHGEPAGVELLAYTQQLFQN